MVLFAYKYCVVFSVYLWYLMEWCCDACYSELVYTQSVPYLYTQHSIQHSESESIHYDKMYSVIKCIQQA